MEKYKNQYIITRFKLLPTPPKTPPATLLITAFKGNKERSDEYKKTQPE